MRALAAAALAVLGAGGVTAYDRETAPPPRLVLAPAPTISGVAAAVERGAASGRSSFVEPLVVTVVLQAGTGRGDSGGGPQPGRVELVQLVARGFELRVPGGTPRVLGELDRRNSGVNETVRLLLDVVVVDCAVDSQAQRTIGLRVRRGDGPVGLVTAAAEPEVSRALDRLVARTCRRPRG